MRYFQKLGTVDPTGLVHALKKLDLGDVPVVELWTKGKEQEAAAMLPQFREPIFNVMRSVEATRLVNAAVHNLSPGMNLDWDKPSAYEIVLLSLPRVSLTIGEESPLRAAGDVWWWRGLEPVWANASEDEALSLLLDLET